MSSWPLALTGALHVRLPAAFPARSSRDSGRTCWSWAAALASLDRPWRPSSDQRAGPRRSSRSWWWCPSARRPPGAPIRAAASMRCCTAPIHAPSHFISHTRHVSLQAADGRPARAVCRRQHRVPRAVGRVDQQRQPGAVLCPEVGPGDHATAGRGPAALAALPRALQPQGANAGQASGAIPGPPPPGARRRGVFALGAGVPGAPAAAAQRARPASTGACGVVSCARHEQQVHVPQLRPDVQDHLCCGFCRGPRRSPFF